MLGECFYIVINVLAIILEMFLRLLTFWWFVCNDGWFAPHIPKRSCYYFSFRCIHCGCIMLTMVVLMLLRLVFFHFFFPVSTNGIRGYIRQLKFMSISFANDSSNFNKYTKCINKTSNIINDLLLFIVVR